MLTQPSHNGTPSTHPPLLPTLTCTY
jgi:hypothetical protein